jgi:hypothetical protein
MFSAYSDGKSSAQQGLSHNKTSPGLQNLLFFPVDREMSNGLPNSRLHQQNAAGRPICAKQAPDCYLEANETGANPAFWV